MPYLDLIRGANGWLYNITADEAREAGASEADITAALDAIEATRQRNSVRARISVQAGDIHSLLGTTADVAALALIGMMQLLIIMSEKGSADVKAAIAAAPIPMPVDKAKALIGAIESGQVKVPALIKGLDKVYEEVAARSTATAEALSQSS